MCMYLYVKRYIYIYLSSGKGFFAYFHLAPVNRVRALMKVWIRNADIKS